MTLDIFSLNITLPAGLHGLKSITFRKTSTRKRWIQCCQKGLGRAVKRNTKPECVEIILTENDKLNWNICFEIKCF